jgi:transposase-like protein
MSRRRTYSDDERAAALAALAANGGNVRRTARGLGIPRATLEHWARGDRHPEAAEDGAPKKALLADLLEGHAYRLLELAMEPERLAGATTQQLMTAFGIAVDKMRLLRSLPTQINANEFADLTDAELDARIQACQRVIAAAENGEAPPAG